MNDGIPEEVEDDVIGGAAFRGVATAPGRAPIAIAIAALVLVGAAVLTRGQSEPATPALLELTPPPQASTTTREAAVTESAVQTLPPLAAQNPAVEPLSTIPPIPAKVGTNQLIPAGQKAVRLTVSLPAGWTRLNDSVFARIEGSAAVGASISAWSLMHVNVFPCRWSADVFADEDLMRSAEGQATALASWWGQDPGMPANSNAAIAPLATTPRVTDLAGLDAWYVEVLVPRALEFANCDGSQVILWHTATGEAKRSRGPGELTRLWVVDVDGEPIVIDASTSVDAAAEAIEVNGIVDSLALGSGEGS